MLKSRLSHLHLAMAILIALMWTVLAPASDTMPDGSEFPMWEKPLEFTKTYYVDNGASNASDSNPGTEAEPFLTINKAAQVLQPGERVVIKEGVYRELIQPARGGTGPDKMISYEAAEGAKVVVKGSAILEDWKPSSGWGGQARRGAPAVEMKVWEFELAKELFPLAYNPFALVNVLQNRFWIDYERPVDTFFRRRGMLFVDGKPLEQVELHNMLAGSTGRSLSAWSEVEWKPLFDEFSPTSGRFWIEHHGHTLHVRLPDDASPGGHVIEATVLEQVFAPAQRHQGYIRVKGITFQHAGNGYPVPQRGLVSTNRGNHFVFEDNTFEWANSVCLDIGNEDWSASAPNPHIGSHVVRNNTFRYCGIEGIGGTGTPGGIPYVLVEGNLFEWVGWQDAAQMSESAAMKLHQSKNLMFRNNVVRHIRYGNGVWLDIGNVNARLTGNVFADIPGTVNPHAIHIEGSQDQNQIDNNIFYKLQGGVLIRDTNNTIVAQNLFIDCEDAGVTSTSGLRAPRPIGGHTVDCRNNRVYNNIFTRIGRAAIEFTNEHNESDGNIYGRLGAGYLRICFPEPPQWLDLPFWQQYYGWDENGITANVDAEFDPDTLKLTLSIDGDLKKVKVFHGIGEDFYGEETGGTRFPGPFNDVDEGYDSRTVDPRGE